MAGCASFLIAGLTGLLVTSGFGQSLPERTVGDSALAANSAAIDSLAVLAAESSGATKPPASLPPPVRREPYLSNWIIARSLGDYLWFDARAFPLQHGAEGQPEMVVSSLLLPGMQVVYGDLFIFHQGYYFPFRIGPDLSVMMFENICEAEILPLSYLGLFAEGQVIHLQSMGWPPLGNPSSLTVARGPYGYQRTAWRFARQFGKSVAASFVTGFKKSTGYYANGADYDGFTVSGALCYRFSPRVEIDYTFYQSKSKQGVMQFDRIIPPFLRLKGDLTYHGLKGQIQLLANQRFEFELGSQSAYAHAYSIEGAYHCRIRDRLTTAQLKHIVQSGRHNLRVNTGFRHHSLSGHAGQVGSLNWAAASFCDSVVFDENHHLLMALRLRDDDRKPWQPAAIAAYQWPLTHTIWASLSLGRHDLIANIYVLDYRQEISGLGYVGEIPIDSYRFIGSPALKSPTANFVSFQIGLGPGNRQLKLSANAEDVQNDFYVETDHSGGNWVSIPVNIDYRRFTFWAQAKYSVTRYFEGTSTLATFIYEPQRVAEKAKHSPRIIASSAGILTLPDVLRGIDIFGSYQAKFVGRRTYYGFVVKTYRPAAVLDASIGFRFGDFRFRIVESNVFDFLGGNSYSLWGEYLMPPGSVWWEFTWDFKD